MKLSPALYQKYLEFKLSEREIINALQREELTIEKNILPRQEEAVASESQESGVRPSPLGGRCRTTP